MRIAGLKVRRIASRGCRRRALVLLACGLGGSTFAMPAQAGDLLGGAASADVTVPAPALTAGSEAGGSMTTPAVDVGVQTPAGSVAVAASPTVVTVAQPAEAGTLPRVSVAAPTVTASVSTSAAGTTVVVAPATPRAPRVGLVGPVLATPRPSTSAAPTPTVRTTGHKVIRPGSATRLAVAHRVSPSEPAQFSPAVRSARAALMHLPFSAVAPASASRPVTGRAVPAEPLSPWDDTHAAVASAVSAAASSGGSSPVAALTGFSLLVLIATWLRPSLPVRERWRFKPWLALERPG
jgi:hypothetical protein